jgi:hypothetical protein
VVFLTASVIPISPILVTLMKEALSFSEMSIGISSQYAQYAHYRFMSPLPSATLLNRLIFIDFELRALHTNKAYTVI